MSTRYDRDVILRPLERTSRAYYVLLGVLLLGSLLFLVGWAYQLSVGVWAATDIGDWGISGQVPWGLYIGGFVWWVGVAHGGIAISAAVRVFKAERFRPIARMSEVLTVLALGMAAMNIFLSLGRPDRVFNTIIVWPSTVLYSPLAWDITVISLYLVLSLTYLGLSLRSEIAGLREELPPAFRPFYALLTIGYSAAEDEKIERILWWLAVAVLALVPLLSGGVVPWLFSLIAAQPGWFGAAAGAAMLTEAITSALAGVVIITAAFRYAYDWHEVIDDRIFKDLAIALLFLSLGTIWFTLHDVLTGVYLAPVNISALTASLLQLEFFWLAIAGLVVSVIGLFLMLGWPNRFFSIPGLVGVAIILAVSILNKKTMFVVEGLMFPTEPPLSNLYPTGSYFPTLVEWWLFGGTIILVALGFVVAAKVIPMVEIHREEVK